MHWVDGHRYPTNESVAQAFLAYVASRGSRGAAPLSVHVHVTPRQACDQRRPYIREALDRWCAALGPLGAFVPAPLPY